LKRSGFGLLQAILVIVLISGILLIALKYAKVSVKQTKDIYLKESVELFMNSAVEMSLLAISGYQRNNIDGCLSQVRIISPDKRFIADINITDYYLLKGSNDSLLCKQGSGYRVHDIYTEESQGMVMLEVTAETNSTHPKNHKAQIILKRRTLQRP